MRNQKTIIKSRLAVLALAKELQSVTLACKRAGISRTAFYDFKRRFEQYGLEGPPQRTLGRPRLNEGPRIPKQIKFRPNTYRLLLQLLGAEQLKDPKHIVSRQEVVERAILHYAEQCYPHLLSNGNK